MVEISSTGDQMLTVLEAVVSGGPLSVAELAARCDMNRTVVHRLLATLNQRGYVRRTDDGFVGGAMIEQLATSAGFGLMAVAKPVMDALAEETGETVVLHEIDGSDAVVVGQAIAERHIVRVQHRPGSRHPLALGASGRAILAFLPQRAAKKLLDRVEDGDILAGKLDDVRRAGFAISHDELQFGVHGLAVPLRQRDGAVTASLGILVPASRAASLAGFAGPLVGAAGRIEATRRLAPPVRTASS